MQRLQTALLLLGVLELAACQPRASKSTLADPPQDVASGSVFTLNKSLVIPAGSAAVQFQDTQLVATEAIRPNYPYCRFGLDGPASAAREIKPQSFTVTSVTYEERSAGSSGEAVSSTQMNLQAGQGAKGYRMSCMLPGAAASARFVTASEINGALGDFFTLKRAY
jgi:hypothetical protein